MKKLIAIAGALAVAAPTIISTPASAANVMTASARADLRCGISTPNQLSLGDVEDLVGGGTAFFADEVSYDCNTSGSITVTVAPLLYEGSQDTQDDCPNSLNYVLRVTGEDGIDLSNNGNDSFTVNTMNDLSDTWTVRPTLSNGGDNDQIELTFRDFTVSSANPVGVCGGLYEGDISIELTANVQS